MSREVTIDNKPMDVTAAQIPAVVFNNPIFTDVSTMKANRTSTYTLPLSEHNKKVIGLLNELDVDNNYMRQIHVLSEFRDGFNIIPKGTAKLLRVTPENIEFSCVWGSIKSIASELDKLTIRELTEEFLVFGAFPPITYDTDKVGLLYTQTFPDNLTSVPPEYDYHYHYPSIRCDYLLDKIQEKCSVPMVMSPEVRAELAKYWVPCLTGDKDMSTVYTDGAASQVILTNAKYPGVDVPYKYKIPGTWVTSTINTPTYDVSKNTLAGIVGVASAKNIVKIDAPKSLHYRINVNANIPNAYQGRILTIRVLWQTKYNSTPNIHSYNWKMGTTPNATFVIENDLPIEEGQFSETYANVQLQIMWEGDIAKRLNINNGDANSVTGTVDLRFWPLASETLTIGDQYPVLKNMPNMTCVDFIKNMMWVLGLYPMTTLSGAVEFKNLNSILANISNTVLLDKRLTFREPRERSFIYGSYAKRNYMRYAEDKTVATNADGYFDISDDTLEKENDVLKLAFAPSDNGSIAAIIPTFIYQQKPDTTWEVVKGPSLQPRLLKRSDTTREGTTYYVGKFPESMYFSSIIPNAYDIYLRLLTNINVCRVVFTANASDISQFNEDTIFYFAGAYWMQLQTTIDGSGLATSDMLKLTIHQKPTE